MGKRIGSDKRTLAQKRARSGMLFSLPFLIGFFVFYLFPVIQSGIFSFARLSASEIGLDIKMVGLENYRYLLRDDPNYLKSLVSSLKDMAINAPCVIFFSFFIAIILNQKFKGRMIARAIMFLPVIITSGVIILLQENQLQGVNMQAIQSSASGKSEGISQMSDMIIRMISTIKISPTMMNFITGAVDRAYDIVTLSGIQILIFLAALQTISPELYEASSIEGATAWENFWKITFPIVSPMILVAGVYTIIDVLGGLQNPLIYSIYHTSFVYTQYGRGSAMGWFYYIFIFIVLGTIYRIYRATYAL